MKRLRLEELESRHVLSGGFFAPQHFGPPPDTGGHNSGFGPAVLGEPPPPPADFGGSGPFNWSGTVGGEASQPFDDEQVVIVIVVVERVPAATTTPDAPITLPTAPAYPKPGATDVGSVSAVAEPAALHVTPAAKVNLQTPIALNATANPPPLEVQVPIAAQLPVRLVRPGETVLVSGGGALPSQVAGAMGTATPPAAEDDGPAEAIPVPQISAAPSLISALPTVDLGAFGRGLRQFLGEIERTGEELVANGDALRPWLIAVAAGAMACEIGRRQWARNQTSDGTGSKRMIGLSDL